MKRLPTFRNEAGSRRTPLLTKSTGVWIVPRLGSTSASMILVVDTGLVASVCRQRFLEFRHAFGRQGTNLCRL